MTIPRSLAALVALLGLILAAPAAAEAAAPELRPGAYVWNAAAAREGPVEVVISLADQRAFVFRGGALIGVSTVSSGREGRESPVGRFQVLEKKRHHRSVRYDNAPMPFMQRLNWYGVALHGGHVPGYPASRGCIRLPMGFARELFAATELGSAVFVTDDSLPDAEAARLLAMAYADLPMVPDRQPGGWRHAR